MDLSNYQSRPIQGRQASYSPSDSIARFEDGHLRAVLDEDVGTAEACQAGADYADVGAFFHCCRLVAVDKSGRCLLSRLIRFAPREGSAISDEV